MRILLLNDAATPGGGAEIMTISLRDEYRRRGHDARIFSSSARYGQQPMDSDYQCYGTTGPLRTINRVFNPSAYRALRFTLAEFKPHVVHVRMFMTQLSPSILPLLKSVPSIYHATWNEVVCPTGLKMLPDGSMCNHRAGRPCHQHGCLSVKAYPLLMLQQKLWRRWRGVFDRIVANSDSIKKSLESEGIGPVEVIFNGVPDRTPRRPLSSPPTIGYCGRLSSEKGLDVLLHAFVEVLKNQPTCRLIIIGDGDARDSLRQQIADAGIESNVTMHGAVDRSEAEGLLASAWAQAVPSKCREGFGLVAAEAMMRGTMVVASRAGGLPEVVSDGQTGFLVKPGSVEELTTALLKCVEDRDRAEKFGRAGRRRALSLFSEATCVEAFLSVYEKMIADA